MKKVTRPHLNAMGYFIALFAFSLLGKWAIAADVEMEALYENVPFDMPKVQLAQIPKTQVSITDFSGTGDGIANNTQAFSSAINFLDKKGGGRLLVPKGIWLTGPIQLRSNIELHVEQGALIKFVTDQSQYPMVYTNFEGRAGWRPMSPIYAKNVHNIAITGQGVIDGSGDSWRLVKKSKMTANQWKELNASGGVLSDDKKIWFPSQQAKAGAQQSREFDTFKYDEQQAKAIKAFLRPVMVSIVDSDKILLDGPTFQNSPAWNIHIFQSQNVIMRNTQVRNPWYAQNSDGIDLDSVKGALIYNNSFDVGDDAICVKSGKDAEGRLRGVPSENMIIKHNVVYHGHGGFVVGSEMSGGVKNILFSHAQFIGTDIGVRFKTTRGRGGIVENIWISDIDMLEIKGAAVSFNMYYSYKIMKNQKDRHGKDPEPVDDTTPQFKDISINRIRAIDVGTAALLQGLPEMNLSNLSIENAYFKSDKGIVMVDVANLKLNKVTLHTQDENALEIYNAKNVRFDDLELRKNGFVSVKGERNKNIHFYQDESKQQSITIKQDGVDKNTVIRHF